MVNRFHITCDIGLFLLFVVFLCLKVSGTIAWSWWIITLPLWIGFVIMFIFLIGIALLAGIVMVIAAIFD